MAQEDVFKKIVSHCKEYGFVFPSVKSTTVSAPFTTTAARCGAEKQYQTVLVASHDAAAREHRGHRLCHLHAPHHLEGFRTRRAFNDPLIDNKDSKKRYRADVLIEDQVAKYDEKIEKEVAKGRQALQRGV